MDETKADRIKEHLSKEFPACQIRITEDEDFAVSFCVQCPDGNRVFLIQRKDMDDCPLDKVDVLLERYMIVKHLQAGSWRRISLRYVSVKAEEI